MKIVFASNNRGKVAELAALFEGLPVDLVPQSDFGVPEAEETGLTFVENAILKARNACHYTGLPAIADDSGLAVDALGGAPGIYSARYAGPNASDADNNRLLLERLHGIEELKRTARFHCLLVYMRHEEDPTPLIFDGRWEGRVLTQPRGEHGFGYDPLFLVPSENATAAELEPAVKNRLSHRGLAVAQLIAALREQFDR